jgi:1-acyl-sn-glycerol-3-phosphate acyltransferase
VEIGLVPMGAFGLTVFAIDLYFARPAVVAGASLSWDAFLSVPGAWRAAMDLTLIGAFAGFYVVPLFAFVQSRAPRERLSRIIAGNNIVNALLICIASGFGIGLTAAGLDTPTIFLVTGVVNIAVAVYIFTLVPEFMMRFITWVLVSTLYRVRVDGLKNVPDEGAAVVVCNHVSFMDPLILMACVRRPMRFVMYYKIFNIPVLNFIFRTAKAIPIAGRNEDPALMEKAFEEIDAALAAGEVVCIFPEGGLTSDGAIQAFRPGIDRILARRPLPVVPLALRGMWGSIFSRRDGALRRARLPRRFWSRIELVGGEALPAGAASASVLEARVSELRGDKA